jgi:O-antigen/teichoic acid export membrane protein
MPFALLILLMSLYYRSDSIMIERLLEDGKFQAGVYAQAFRFMEALNMIAYLFAGLLLPIFSRMLKERADVSGLLWLAIRLLLGGAIGVAILSSFYGTEIMALRYSEYTELSGPAFTLLMWSFVLMSVSYMTGTLLTAQGNLGFLNRLSAAGMLLNICLNFLVIPIWYAYGAALTSLITQGLIMVIQIVYLLRTRLIHVELKLLMRILLFIGGGVALVALIPQGSMSNGLLLLILAACMGLWAFLSGMIDIRGIVRLLRERQNAELSENERFA